MGTIQHILAGCKVALSQGRYRWRHDKVLKQISEQVVFHCDRRVNTYKNKAGDGRQFIDFVPAGRRKAGTNDRKESRGFGILGGSRDWIVLSDIEGQLKFPSEIVEIRLRPDLVIFSRSVKTVIWWELTVPSEERISESHEYSLQTEIQAEGWCCYNVAVEVGARGVVAQSLERAARRIGL